MSAIIDEEPTITEESKERTIAQRPDTAHQLLVSGKLVTHNPKAGLNPLVDVAACLFSLMGKLKQLKSYRHLGALHNELIQEINTFQTAAKAHGYSSEYIVFSRYALCTSLDDIISNTPWGAKGQWQEHSLLNTFNHGSNNQDPITQERFFVILDRLIKDPALYIDLMEFMYICLSLGFKGQYRSTEYNKTQLEQITHSLYKHIRAFRGEFSKTLSPFPLKPFTPAPSVKTRKKMPLWFIALITLSLLVTLFFIVRQQIDATSFQAYQDLTRTGKSIPL